MDVYAIEPQADTANVRLAGVLANSICCAPCILRVSYVVALDFVGAT